MQIPFYNCEELAHTALIRSSIHRQLKDNREITADDLFMGIFDAMKFSDLYQPFCISIELYKNTKLEKALGEIVKEENDRYSKTKKILKAEHFHFEKQLKMQLDPLMNDQNNKLDILDLLAVATPLLSDDLKSQLKTKQSNYRKIQASVEKLIQV